MHTPPHTSDGSEQSLTVASQSGSAVFPVVCGLANLTRKMKCPHLIHIIVLLLACLFFTADTCKSYTEARSPQFVSADSVKTRVGEIGAHGLMLFHVVGTSSLVDNSQ